MNALTHSPPLIPFAGYRAWSVECCRSCEAWLPSLDLGLPSANRREWRPGYLDFGSTRRAVEAAVRS